MTMRKRILKLMLTACIIIGAVPLTGLAASKPAAPATLKAKGHIVADSDGLKFTWKKVNNVSGYQYRYKLYSDGVYFYNTTKKVKATIDFLDFENVTFQVRAYKEQNGKKVFGAWKKLALSEKKVQNLIRKEENENAPNPPKKVKAVVKYNGGSPTIEYSWSKQSDVTGYQYRYCNKWTDYTLASQYKLGSTKKNSSPVFKLGKYGNVDFMVRGYVIVDGKRVYGMWKDYYFTKSQMKKRVKKAKASGK